MSFSQISDPKAYSLGFSWYHPPLLSSLYYSFHVYLSLDRISFCICINGSSSLPYIQLSAIYTYVLSPNVTSLSPPPRTFRISSSSVSEQSLICGELGFSAATKKCWSRNKVQPGIVNTGHGQYIAVKKSTITLCKSSNSFWSKLIHYKQISSVVRASHQPSFVFHVVTAIAGTKLTFE